MPNESLFPRPIKSLELWIQEVIYYFVAGHPMTSIENFRRTVLLVRWSENLTAFKKIVEHFNYGACHAQVATSILKGQKILIPAGHSGILDTFSRQPSVQSQKKLDLELCGNLNSIFPKARL